MPNEKQDPQRPKKKTKLPGENAEIGIEAVKAAIRYQTKRPNEQQQQQNQLEDQWE